MSIGTYCINVARILVTNYAQYIINANDVFSWSYEKDQVPVQNHGASINFRNNTANNDCWADMNPNL